MVRFVSLGTGQDWIQSAQAMLPPRLEAAIHKRRSRVIRHTKPRLARLRRAAIIVIGWLASAGSVADDWVIRHLTTDDGLPVRSVAAARTDPSGFLWLATQDGLVRFDGGRFATFDLSTHAEIGSNQLTELASDAAGRLHALTSAGRMLRIRSNGIDVMVPDPSDPDAIVLRLLERPLCAVMVRALSCEDGSGGSLEVISRVPDGMTAINAAPDGGGGAWWLTDDGAVWHVREGRSRLVMEKGNRADLLPDVALALLALDERGVLVADSDHLVLLSVDGKRQEIAVPEPLESPWLSRPDRQRVRIGTNHRLYELDLDRLALKVLASQEPEGIGRGWAGEWFSLEGRLFDNGVPVLEADGRILDLFPAADGSIWVSTERDGLYALVRPRVEVIHAGHGLVSENLYAISRGPDGRIWTGSLGGGVQVFEGRQITAYGVDDGLPGANTWVVAAARDGTVLTASYRPGLFSRAPGAAGFMAVELPEGLDGHRIHVIDFDARDRLWVGGTSGIWLRDDSEWTQVWDSGTEGDAVRAILRSDSGSLWWGSDSGLWRDGNDGASQPLSDQVGRVQVRGLTETSDGTIWASTLGKGLLRIREDTGPQPTAVLIDRSHGLPSNSLHAVVEDGSGALWINSNQGIFRLTPNDLASFLDGTEPALSPLVLTQADGLLSSEGNGGVQPASARDGDGGIWFTGQGGAVRVDPDRLRLRDAAPVALIDELRTGLRAWSPSEFDRLALGQRSLSVRFAAPDLHGGGRERFRYRLHPGSGKWQDLRGQSGATFSQLRPGQYQLEVLAGNADGLWSRQPTELAFSVPAFWYETRLFQYTVIVLLLLSAAALVRYRIASLRERARRLDRQVTERTAELNIEKSRVEQALSELGQAHEQLEANHDEIAKRNRQLAGQAERLRSLDGFRKRLLANISHELRTPMMLIGLPLDELERSLSRTLARDPGARRSLELARRQTDRMARLVNQLVDLVQAESGQLRLAFSRLDAAALLARIREDFASLARQRDVQLDMALPSTLPPVYADADQLVSAIGNLVDNALKHAPEGSVVRLSADADRDRETLVLSVADHGPGIEPGRQALLFERFRRGPDLDGVQRDGLGIGLALAREIVTLHGGRIGAEPNKPCGARFWIELPLGSSHVAVDELALDADSDATQPSASESPAPANCDRILLVEDHPDLAAYLGERLRAVVPVTVVGSAEEALQALVEERFRLVVSDVMLPGLSGLALCRQLRADEALSGLPVILISAKGADADIEAGSEVGADAYLVKPFSLDELLDTVRRVSPGLPAGPAETHTQVSDPILATAEARIADAEFGVSAWAAAVHLSSRQLRRRVSELTGQSPLVWLRQRRLLEVRRMIDSGKCRTLAEAGARCGIENPDYLYRLYRARYGD